MDASQVLIESIEDAGIDYVFGLPGSVTMNTIDKIVNTDMEFISTRHEQTATTMADGYAKVTKQPGVTLVHVGPGVANQVLGLGAAHRDNSPIVAIGGNEDLERLGRDVWHEWDVEGVLDPITKWLTRLEQEDDAARTMRTALLKSISGRPGPVFIDLPKGISRTESVYPDADREFYDHNEVLAPFVRSRPEEPKVDAVIDLIEDAENPLLLAGGGCVWSDASTACRAVVEALDLPIATSESGRGVVSETHPNSLGLVGTRGPDAANEAIEKADLVIAVGARFSALTTKDWTIIDPDADLVQVDIDPEEFAFQYPVELSVMADARSFLEELHERVDGTDRSLSPEDNEVLSSRPSVRAELDEFFEYELTGEQINPSQFFGVLNEERDDDAIITHGGGVHATFNQRLPAHDQFSHLHAISFGAMSYGFPLAMGAKLGAPDRQVICVEGDGGFAMVMQDIETAVRYNIDVNVLIYNNFSHGTQKLRQARIFDERYLGTDVDNPHFDRIAEEFGAHGERVESPEELPGAIRRTLTVDGPSVLDVIVDPWDWPDTDNIAQI